MSRGKVTRQQFQRQTGPTAAPRLITDGALVTDDAVWAWVQIPDSSTELMEDNDLVTATLANATALSTLLPTNADFHIKVMWAQPSGLEYLDSWAEVDSVRAPKADKYLDLGAERIEVNAEQGIFRQRIVLLGLRWPDGTASASGVQGARAAARALRSRRAAQRSARDRFEEVRAELDGWIRQMEQSPLLALRAPAPIIAWAAARELRRGVAVNVPPESELGEPQLASLMHGQVDPGQSPTWLEVTDLGTQTRRYVSILVPAASGLPTSDWSIPGAEWAQHIAAMDGVEWSLRGVNHGQAGSFALINDARKMIGSQLSEAGEQGAQAPQEVLEADEQLQERRSDIQRRVDTEFTVHPRWIVDAASPKELAARIDDLQQWYSGLARLEVAANVQDLLWKELIPGDQTRVGEFGQYMPGRTLAGAWPHGGSAVGDGSGPYVGGNLGASRNEVRVHVTSRSDSDRSRPTTIACTGMSGQGKSTFVDMMSLGALAEGAWELLVDPKGDLAGIVDAAREVLGVPVQVVDVADPSSSGTMDPMRFTRTADEARSLTLTAMLGALNADDRRRGEAVIEAAIDVVLQRPRGLWSAPAVIGELIATPLDAPLAETARALGQTLVLRAKTAAMRPVLGPIADNARPLMTGRGLVYLSLAALDLPRHSPDPDQWSVSERCSIATFRVALSYALHQSRAVRELKKIVAITELHLITKQPEGLAFVEGMARLGRALQLYLLLDTQSARDLARLEGLPEQLVMAFAFRADGEDEQDAQAALLGRPHPGPQMRAALSSLEVGQCVFRDRHGRIAPIEIDRLSEGIATMLRTDAPEDSGTYEDAIDPGPTIHDPAATDSGDSGVYDAAPGADTALSIDIEQPVQSRLEHKA